MARLFETTLSGRVRIYTKTVRNHVTELGAREGIADFVLSPTRLQGERLEWVTKLASCISTPGVASVTATLRARRATPVTDVIKRCGLTRKSTLKALSELVRGGVAEGNVEAGFRLRRPVRESDIELWAYELKLKDWRRGIYQALQYKAFAHSVAIVIPHQRANAMVSRLGRFRAYRVGLLTFDASTGKIGVLVRPHRSHPRSLPHYLYALSMFVRGLPWHPEYTGPPKRPVLPSQKRRDGRRTPITSRSRTPVFG